MRNLDIEKLRNIDADYPLDYPFNTGSKSNQYSNDCISNIIDKIGIGKFIYYNWFFFTDDYEFTYPKYAYGGRCMSKMTAFQNQVKEDFPEDFKSTPKKKETKKKEPKKTMQISKAIEWLELYKGSVITDELIKQFKELYTK